MKKELYSPLRVPNLGYVDQSSNDDLIGLLEESGVRANIDQANWPEYPYKPLTTFSLAHTDKWLYIDFFVRCNFLRAMNYETNAPVCEDSAVAMSIQTDLSLPKFYGLEFNCLGTCAGYVFEPGCEPKPIEPAVLESIKVYPSCGKKPFRELEGLFSWNILVGIPLELIGLTDLAFPVAVKGNFYKCASGTQQPHCLSWQPVSTTAPDFNSQESFKEIILE